MGLLKERSWGLDESIFSSDPSQDRREETLLRITLRLLREFTGVIGAVFLLLFFFFELTRPPTHARGAETHVPMLEDCLISTALRSAWPAGGGHWQKRRQESEDTVQSRTVRERERLRAETEHRERSRYCWAGWLELSTEDRPTKAKIFYREGEREISKSEIIIERERERQLDRRQFGEEEDIYIFSFHSNTVKKLPLKLL